MQEVHCDGSRGPIAPYDEKEMHELLAKPDVKEVAVFSLRVGQIVHVLGHRYRVERIRPNGKVTLKPLKPLPESTDTPSTATEEQEI